jgi:DNA-binding XRE family transcriptional regulator|nr:MAG TPA: putative transcriptional regulator [Caudoviricetes sp.]
MTAIKEAREKAGLTQAQVYKLIGVPVRTVQDWEAEKRQPPAWAERLIIEKLNAIVKKGENTMQITKKEINKLQAAAFEQFKANHGIEIFGNDNEISAFEISEGNKKTVELLHPGFAFTDNFYAELGFNPNKAKTVLLFTVNRQTKQLVWRNRLVEDSVPLSPTEVCEFYDV